MREAKDRERGIMRSITREIDDVSLRRKRGRRRRRGGGRIKGVLQKRDYGLKGL